MPTMSGPSFPRQGVSTLYALDTWWAEEEPSNTEDIVAPAQASKVDLFDAGELHGKLPKFVPLLTFKVSRHNTFWCLVCGRCSWQ